MKLLTDLSIPKYLVSQFEQDLAKTGKLQIVQNEKCSILLLRNAAYCIFKNSGCLWKVDNLSLVETSVKGQELSRYVLLQSGRTREQGTEENPWVEIDITVKELHVLADKTVFAEVYHNMDFLNADPITLLQIGEHNVIFDLRQCERSDLVV